MITLDRLSRGLDQLPCKYRRSNKGLIKQSKGLSKALLLRSNLRTRHRLHAIRRGHDRMRRTASTPPIPRVTRMETTHILTPALGRCTIMTFRETVAISDRHVHMRHGGRVGNAGDLQRVPGILVGRETGGRVIGMIKLVWLGR
jgi:hypothetical protein